MTQGNRLDSDWARGLKQFQKAMQHMTVENVTRNLKANAKRFNEMVSEGDTMTHFWYSRDAAEYISYWRPDRAPNMALINGMRVHYNIANKRNQHGTHWVDPVYLGAGQWTPTLAADQAIVEDKKGA